MNYLISLSDEAKLNIKEALHYYNKVSESLENKFSSELRNTISEIKQNPFIFQLRYRKIRIAHTKIFPFGIHFIIEDKTIYIFKILHHKKFYK